MKVVVAILCILHIVKCSSVESKTVNNTEIIHKLSEAIRSKLVASPEALRANLSREMFKHFLQLAYAEIQLQKKGKHDDETLQSVPSVVDHSKHEEAHQNEANSPAGQLVEQVRVLCMVLTHPKNHKAKAQHVKATWGKRCNKLVFMSTAGDTNLSIVKLPVREGWEFLWGKTKAAFKYVYKYYRQQADWFLKTDDDTYVVVDNLRLLLSSYNSSDPIYFGCRFKSLSREKNAQGYMSGGAGYVLSLAALKRFVKKGLAYAVPNKTKGLCQSGDKGPEDSEMGKCLERVGVKAMDSRDSQGRGRFFPFNPQQHLFPIKDKSFWYEDYKFYPSEEGLNCCSDEVISFHYIKPTHMYVLDYLIYHLGPYKAEKTMSIEEVPFLKESLVTTTGDYNEINDTVSDSSEIPVKEIKLSKNVFDIAESIQPDNVVIRDGKPADVTDYFNVANNMSLLREAQSTKHKKLFYNIRAINVLR